MKKFGKKIITIGCIFAWCLLIAFGFNVSSSYASPQQLVSLVEQKQGNNGSSNLQLPENLPQLRQNIPTEELAKYTFLPDSVEEKMKENWDKHPLTGELDKYLLDGHAWTLFALINQKCPNQLEKSNNALWETWADDPETFPESGDPVWPGDYCFKEQNQTRTKKLRSRSKVEFADGLRTPRSTETDKIVEQCDPTKTPCEEVRRNKDTFDYIVNNNLWNQNGLVANFGSGKKIDFPITSVEIKANWKSIEEKDKPNYHWNYTADDKLVGLVAMHVITKEFPNWFWATWEHVDNDGRCDFIGCHDSFGGDPHDVPPKWPTKQKYDAGNLTEDLEDLLKEQPDLKYDEWKNYRLKGTQINFVDSAGKPTLLGNSVTEEGFVQTSSCITCHARATINIQGTSGLQFPGSKPDNQSYNGAPNPKWFDGLKQTDFVWAMGKRFPK
jgi:hypothetical protein